MSFASKLANSSPDLPKTKTFPQRFIWGILEIFTPVEEYKITALGKKVVGQLEDTRHKTDPYSIQKFCKSRTQSNSKPTMARYYITHSEDA